MSQSTSPNLLCLSSGMTPQYRLDILRLLALPRGASIQFRYGEGILPDGLRPLLANNAIVSARVLLAYVDCSPPARRPDNTCPIMPCRHASLVSSKKIGTRYFLELRLEEFAPCSDLEGFQKSVTGNRPHWVGVGVDAGVPEVPVGHWCLESAAGAQACSRSAEIGAWEGIVTQLKKAEAFRDEQLFFAVQGMSSRKSSGRIQPEDSEYRLESESDYELMIYHFHPMGDKIAMDKGTALIKVEVSEPYIEPVTSPAMPIDSPYDLKTFRFRTRTATKREYGSIVVRIDDRSTGKPVESQPELYIPVRLTPSFLMPLVLTLGLGALLAVQQLATISITKGGIGLWTVMLGHGVGSPHSRIRGIRPQETDVKLVDSASQRTRRRSIRRLTLLLSSSRTESSKRS
jgi:hypothetical protein